MTLDADGLRSAFTEYFVARGHLALPPAGLIPHDPTVLFTIAGMVPFKPYFTGEQAPPAPRATTVQPCFRMVDIDIIGTTARHTTLFEMLGNFSFGDYFKETAIPLAFEFVTDVLGIDPDRLWVTVHESDTDATGIWEETAHLRPERIQRLGEPNFWRMGEVGPCGPCSEIYYDRGEAFGPDGGPAHGGEERFVEIWNLVFMQYERAADGSLTPLPRTNIDTGAGLERILAILEGVDSVFATDVMAPVVDVAARLTGQRPGHSPEGDVALRILADHARAMAFLISDGVFPTNEGRGYVLRRVIRRAVLRAYQLGVSELVTPPLTRVVTEVMANAYPKLARDASLLETVVAHEEEAFRRTLRAGSTLIEEALGSGVRELSGDVAFTLHDTYGFPIDLTVEIAEERAVSVDRAGFDEKMAEQRARARQHGRSAARDQTRDAPFRAVLEEFGPSEFLGYKEAASEARVLAVEPRGDGASFTNIDGASPPEGAELFEVVLDRTPFYAEGGGQVGDTGVIEGDTGRFVVLDTTRVVENLTGHAGYFDSGGFEPGASVRAAIDEERRAAIRRNHTATHLLQAALRARLGAHVQQQGSLVAPDRLRFDFSHYAALSDEEVEAVEDLVNSEILADDPVRTYETTRQMAEDEGAIAFFGEKYGDVVRVVEAGDVSAELCGGTHVSATGMIGPFKVLSEASIGANTRRIEATTGKRSLAEFRHTDTLVARAAGLLKTTPEELPDALGHLLAHDHALEDELRQIRHGHLREEARALVATASGGRVVARRDGLDGDELRELALLVRDQDGIEAVGLGGSPDGTRALLVVAARPGGIDARPLAGEAAKLVGGGGGGEPQLANAGGRNVAGLDAALARLSELLAAS